MGGKHHDDQHPQAKGADDLNDRVDEFAGLGFFDLEMGQGMALVPVAGQLLLFKPVGLDEADASKGLNQAATLADSNVEGLAGQPLETVAHDDDRKHHQGNDHQGRQGELGINNDHPGQDAEQGEGLLD